MSQKTRVAICGGGIGGLTLALLLSRLPNLDVQLYEATAQFKEIGAGVIMWSRTWRIMELMGLADELSQLAHSPPSGEPDIAFDFRRSDAPETGFSFAVVKTPYGCIRFHRAQFLDVLVNHLPGGIANFNKRLVSYVYTNDVQSEGPVMLTFADGTIATCDILIGADGIKSCIRGQMYRTLHRQTRNDEYLQYVEPQWTGAVAYRGLVPVDQLMKTETGKDEHGNKGPHRAVKHPTMYCGKSRHIVSYTISRGSIVNVSTAVSEPHRLGEKYPLDWVVDVTKEELLNAYGGWEPETVELLECVDKPTKWAIHQLPLLPYFVQDRVALLGDAAHAMTPHQGAGAGQAIEDAFILAGVLSKVTPSTYSSWLHAYEAIRLPAAHKVQSDSYENGLMYHFWSDYGNDYERLAPVLGERWKWLTETTVQEAVRQAIELGQKSVVDQDKEAIENERVAADRSSTEAVVIMATAGEDGLYMHGHQDIATRAKL